MAREQVYEDPTDSPTTFGFRIPSGELPDILGGPVRHLLLDLQSDADLASILEGSDFDSSRLRLALGHELQDWQVGEAIAQPTRVLGRVMGLQSTQQTPGFGRWECLVRAGRLVRVQVVEDARQPERGLAVA